MFNPFTLEDKTILVTGASSGIGRSIAFNLAKMGATVLLTARNEERLQETLDGVITKGSRYILADLNCKDEIDKLINEFDFIDGLVCCAGIIKTLPVKHISDDAIEEIFETNLLSNIRLCSKLLRKKKITRGGSVVMISSVSTSNVKIGNSLYSATKGGLNSFAKAMALEVARQEIRVNCIQPGFIPSGILDNSGIEKDDFLKFYEERHPLGLGHPSDIANASIYLLSDASRWVTGSILTIDGGYTLQ